MQYPGNLDLQEKKQALYDVLRRYDNIAIAYSGGVDSTLLLAAAARAVKGKVVAITAVSPLQPVSEVQEAFKVARSLGVEHHRVDTFEMENESFVANSKNRCYICKKLIFSDIMKVLDEIGIATVAHAANADDLKDFRPGMRAAKELGIASPLIEANMTKDDIRELSRQMELPTWNKPSAACLASRIPYGMTITTDALKMIEAAESVLAALGFVGFRVRHYGETAKIEVRPADFSRLINPERRLTVISEFQRLGYAYITMDLEGFSSGRLNRCVEHRENGG